MSTTFVENKETLNGNYSLTAYSGGDLGRCLQLSVHNNNPEGYKSVYSNYTQLTQNEVRELIKDLQDFLDRNY